MQQQTEVILQGTSRVHAGLPGAWLVNVIPSDTDVLSPSVAVTVINSDGTMVNINHEGRAAAGQWVRTGESNYAVTFVGFFPDDDQPLRFKVRATLTLNESEDVFGGPFLTIANDPAGNEVLSYRGNVSGARMDVEPLG